MKTVLKRVLALALTLCLLIGFVPAAGTAHAIPTGRTLTYTGSLQALVNHDPNYQYFTSCPDWLGGLPAATEVGVYKILCTPIDMFEEEYEITAYILPVAAEPTVSSGLVYNGSEQILATAAANSFVSLDGVNWFNQVSATAAGSYFVQYKTVVNGLESAIGGLNVEIAKKELTPSVAAFSLVYSGSGLFTRDIDVSGAVSGDDVSATANFVLDSSNAGERTYTLNGFNLFGADMGNYFIDSSASLSGSCTVSPLPITVSIDAGQSKTYLQATPAISYSVSATDAANEYILAAALSASPIQGEPVMNGEAAGSYEVAQGTLTNANNPNFDITFVSADFEITPYKLNVSGLSAAEKVYDGTVSVSIDDSNKVVESLPAGFSLVSAPFSAEFESAFAGEAVPVVFTPGTLSVTDADGNEVGSNFELVFAPVTGKITPAGITVTDLKIKSRYYDGSDILYSVDIDDSNAKYTGGVDIFSVEFAEECGTYDSRHAGKDKSVTVNPEKITVYDSYGVDITDSVTLSFDLSGDILPIGFGYAIDGKNKSYDGSTAANISITPYTLHSEDELIVNFSANYADKNVGSHNISFSNISLGGAQAGNYVLSSGGISCTGEITPAALTVTPKAVEIEYLDAEPTIGYDVTGLVEGDTLSGALSRESGNTPGSYAVKIGTLDNPNYDISLVPQNFVITKRNIGVTGFTAADKEYDGNTDATVSVGSVSFTNLPAGRDFSGYESLTVTSASFADANAGENKAVIANIHLGFSEDTQPADMQHFVFTAESLTADITPKAVELTVSNDEKTFGDEDPAFTVTAPESLVIAREEGENAGEYEFSVESGAGGNYSYSFANKFVIKPASINDADFDAEETEMLYTGSQLDLSESLSISFKDKELAGGTDYLVSGNKQTKIGSYSVGFKGIGNFKDSASMTFSILPPEIIEDVLDESITPENAKLSDREELELLKEALATIDEDTVHTDLEDWKDAAEKLEDILAALDRLEAALAAPDTSDADAIDRNDMELSDKEIIEEAAKAVEEHLDEYSDLLDPAVKAELEEKLENYEEMIALIEEAEDFIEKLEKWLDKWLPYADADELWLRGEFQKQLKKLGKLSPEAQTIVYKVLGKKIWLMEDRLYTYYIVKGHNQLWLTSSNEGAEFTCNGHVDLFVGVYVDEKLVDAKDYTVKSGSTVIRFSTEFMKTLEKGKHQIQFRYKDAYSTVGLFTVADHATPRTADTSMPALWLSMMLVSAAGICMILRRRKELCE